MTGLLTEPPSKKNGETIAQAVPSTSEQRRVPHERAWG